MIKIVLDGFGGDRSPQANAKGAIDALAKNEDLSLVVTGDSKILEKEFSAFSFDKSRLEIVDAPEVIDCGEKPTDAIKRTNTSLVKALDILRTDDSVSGMVTVGSTGVVLVGAVLRVGRIRGVARPAFCPVLPTMNGGLVGVCDSGANAECDVKNLTQFALMGSLYMKHTYGIENPRVALLNVGTEEGKGDTLRKETFEALKQMKNVNFVGNMESRDLLSGNYDLVVADGFSGNVLIKSTEGTASELLKLLKKTFTSSFKNKIGALLLKKSVYGIKDMLDYNNYGGGVTLGTKKIVIKGHGSSKASAITNCILQAYTMKKAELCQAIADEIAKIDAETPQQ